MRLLFEVVPWRVPVSGGEHTFCRAYTADQLDPPKRVVQPGGTAGVRVTGASGSPCKETQRLNAHSLSP